MEGGPPKSPGIHQRTVQSADDLVSVTVRKETPDQKAGISLVERHNAVYVTKVADGGLFHLTEVGVGDKVLSINGKRLKPGEGARHIIKHITSARATVTMVVKKAGITPSRGARGGVIKKKPQRIFRKDFHRNEDGSLNAELDPRNLPTDDDDKDQIPIKGYKIFAGQPVGVTLVDHDNMIFVAAISLDSIFRDTTLQIGDRVVAVNGMNFMAYADAAMATKNGEKSPKEVIFVVEKGHVNLPDVVKQNLQKETDAMESPTRGRANHDDDDDDDDFLKMMMTPKRDYNSSSYLGKGESPSWKTPRGSDSESEESVNGVGGAIDMMARVLGRQARGGDGSARSSQKGNHGDGSPTSGTNSDSMSNSFPSTPGGRGNGKGGRTSGTPTRNHAFVNPTVTPQRRSIKATTTKAKPVVDDDSDEESLGEELVAVANKLARSSLKGTNDDGNPMSNSNSDSMTFPSTPTGRGSRKGVRTSGTPTRKYAFVQPLMTPQRRVVKATTTSPVVDDTDERSLGEEELEAAAAEALSPEKKRTMANQMSFNASLSKMRPKDYDGDYIKVRIEKTSEDDPGIKVKKTEGIFILTAVPDHEKRIHVGMRVLAINGAMNIHTVAKADDLMGRTKGYVTLMVDYASPMDRRRICPCCGDPIYPNGEHVSGKKGRGRVKADDDMSVFSTESSIHTAPMGNRTVGTSGGGGLRSKQQRSSVPSIPEASYSKGGNVNGHDGNGNGNRYNVDEYESDDDNDNDDGSDGRGRGIGGSNVTTKTPTTPTSKRPTALKQYQAGDKFMIRITKEIRDPGISLFDYKGDIYVGEIVRGGGFYQTPIEVGDIVLSVNGRKASVLKSASHAMDVIDGRDTVSMFLMRPDRRSAEYKEAMKRGRQ